MKNSYSMMQSRPCNFPLSSFLWFHSWAWVYIFNADCCTHTVWAFDCYVATDNKASCYLSQDCSVRHFDEKPSTCFALLHTDVSLPNVIYLMAKSRVSILWINNEICVGEGGSAGSRNISNKSFFATSNIVWGQAGRLDCVREFRFLKITPDVRDEYVSTMYSEY